jgi:hypothetical protein
MLPGTIFAPKSRIIDLNEGIGLNHRLGFAHFLGHGLCVAPPRAVGHAPDFDGQARQMTRRLQRLLQAITGCRLVQGFPLDAQQPVFAVARHQLRLQSQFPGEC